MKKPIIRIKREFKKMKQHERPTYMLKHGNAVIKNSSTFPGIPYDGATINANSLTLLEILSAKRKGKKTDISYTDQLNLCIKMIYDNYDYVDYVSGGDIDINKLSGMNSRKNTKPRTKRPKKDTAAKWVPEINANELTLETTRDEVSRMTVVIHSNDEEFNAELVQQNRVKITLGGKSCLLDFSTAAKIKMKYLEGGKPVNAFLTKVNANGLAPMRELPKIVPNVDGNYRPDIPKEIPKKESDSDAIPKEEIPDKKYQRYSKLRDRGKKK